MSNKYKNLKLEDVPGIGPKRLEILKDVYASENKGKKLKFNDIYEIRVFHKLTAETKAFLIYKPELEVNYRFIKKVDNFFKTHKISGIIAGSYRRKKLKSKDIDFISYLSFEKMKKILEKNNVELYVHSKGTDKVGAILNIFNKTVRIDIWFPKKDERVFYLFYATGNVTFNIIMRDAAKKQGYLLNRHGLFNTNNNKQIRVRNIRTEKDIMAKLGKKYIKPEKRNY